MSDDRPIPVSEQLSAHAEFLRRLAAHLVPDGASADDLAQDACLAALTARGAPRGGLRPWLAGVVRNLHRMARRGEVRRVRRERAAPAPAAAAGPDELAERLEVQELLLRAVRALDEPYRSTVVLRFYEDLTPAEIGERQGLPAATVRTRLHRALAMLRGRLDREHGGSRRAWVALLLPLPAGRGPVPAGCGAGAGGAALGGAFAMKLASAVVGILLLLLLVLPGSLRLLREGPGGGEAPPRPEAAAAGPSSAAATADPTPAGAEALPPPVDFARADRDLDLCGRVVDGEGRPLGGAEVALLGHPFLAEGGWRWKTIFDVEPFAAGRAAADGSFLFRLGRGRHAALRVRAAGRAEAVLPLCAAGERIDVAMTGGAGLDVLALDEDEAPVEGVILWLFRSTLAPMPALVRSGRTDAGGRCRFEGVTPGRTMVYPEHPRLGTTGWQFVLIPGEGETTLEVRLVSGREIAGRVFDAETGAPIAGALVGETPIFFRAVMADADGRFALPGFAIPEGGQLWCRADGYAEAAVPVPERGPLGIGLRRGAAAIGRVVTEDGAGLGGVRVEVFTPGTGTSFREVFGTDEEGRFTASGLRRDLPLVLSAGREGRGTVRRLLPALPEGPEPLDLGSIVLPAARLIEGVLARPSGAPLSSVPVRLAFLGPWPETGSRFLSGRTDDLGRFRFPDLSPGRYRLSFLVRGSEPVLREVEIPDEGDLPPLTVTVPGEAALVVRVVDPAGAPVGQVAVRARQGEEGCAAFTGADGRAVLEGLGPDPVLLAVDLQFGDPRPLLGRRCGPVAADGREVTVELAPAEILEGTVLAPDGRGLGLALVRVLDAGTGESVVRDVTFPDGTFRLRLPGGLAVDVVVDGTRYPEGTGRPPVASPLRGELRGLTFPCRPVTILTR